MTISCKHFTKKYCEVCCSSKDNKLILEQNTRGSMRPVVDLSL